MVSIEVVYIPEKQTAIQLTLILQSGATIEDAISESGLRETHPEIEGMPVGIFAKSMSMDTVLKTGDRVEIYRPLTADPKDKRRERARRMA